jgi:hypothetical protein
MKMIKLANGFGIIVKKNELDKANIGYEKILEIFEVFEPFDETDELLSFGPHFGKEASSEFVRRLDSAGLVYGDDYYDFTDFVPDWCQVYIKVKE